MTPEDLKTLVSIAAAIISLISFAVTFGHTRYAYVRSLRPILVFVYSKQGWVLRNVGHGPALNVIVAQKRVRGEWFRPVRVPPLAKDGEMLLEWLDHVNDTGLGSSYEDAEGRTYSSTCGNDLSRTYVGRRLPEWDDRVVELHWNVRTART